MKVNHFQSIQRLLKFPMLQDFIQQTHPNVTNCSGDNQQINIIYQKSHFIKQFLQQHLPQLSSQSSIILSSQDIYSSFHKLLNLYSDLGKMINAVKGAQTIAENYKQQIIFPLPTQKKITRAAIARRDQKVQQQLRKDQIFVRLTPRSHSCMQFMLMNRNFPRIQCKLSCNQHIEYLINYLTNKWIRGKMGYRLILYPDSTTYLKNSPQTQREKVIYQPLNNFLMFTDIMIGSQIGQNGTLDIIYEIIEINKEKIKKNKGIEGPSKPFKQKQKQEFQQNKVSESTQKQIVLIQPRQNNLSQPHQYQSFTNKNVNNIGQQSLFNSIGFNIKSIQDNPLLDLMNSNSYLNINMANSYHMMKEQKQDSMSKLGNIINAIVAVQKEEQMNEGIKQNKLQSHQLKVQSKQVRKVDIVKKKNNP